MLIGTVTTEKKKKNSFFTGTVINSFKGNTFEVKLDENDKIISARCAGKLWKNSIRIDVDNRVKVKLPSNPDDYDKLEGLIVYRL